MMHPPNLAFIATPPTRDPYVCLVYKRKDGTMFYGSTWRDTTSPRRAPNVQYLVRIRLKPEALL